MVGGLSLVLSWVGGKASLGHSRPLAGSKTDCSLRTRRVPCSVVTPRLGWPRAQSHCLQNSCLSQTQRTQNDRAGRGAWRRRYKRGGKAHCGGACSPEAVPSLPGSPHVPYS